MGMRDRRRALLIVGVLVVAALGWWIYASGSATLVEALRADELAIDAEAVLVPQVAEDQGAGQIVDVVLGQICASDSVCFVPNDAREPLREQLINQS